MSAKKCEIANSVMAREQLDPRQICESLCGLVQLALSSAYIQVASRLLSPLPAS